MQFFRMKVKDTEAVQIDAQWQSFLQQEKAVTADIGDYYYKDAYGDMKVMEKANFERLFAPVV